MRLILILFSLISNNIFAENAKDCLNTNVYLNNVAFSKVAEDSFNYLFHDENILKDITTSVKNYNYAEEIKLHKILFNMNVSIKRFSEELVKTEVSLKNNLLKQLNFGTIKIFCENKNCRLKVPIKDLSLVGNFTIKCLEDFCMGENLISIKQFNFKINSKSDNDAYIDFELNINTEAKINEMYSINPQSIKLFISPKVQSLKLDLTQEEERIVHFIYKSSFENKKKEFESKKTQIQNKNTKIILRDMEDVRMYAMADSLSKYLENFNSFAYYSLIGAALKENEVKEVQDILSKTFGANISKAINESLQKMPQDTFRPLITFDTMTPSELLQLPNVEEIKKKKPQFSLQINKLESDSEGNYLLPISTCNEKIEYKKKLKFKTNELKEGFDFAASIPIVAINNYLKRSFSDRDLNSVYYEDMAIFESSKKVGLNTKVRLIFNSPPVLLTLFNKNKRKYDLYLKLDVTESPYNIKFLKKLTIPFVSSTFSSNVLIDFDKISKSVNMDFDKTNMSISKGQPIIFISDLISIATPIRIIKEIFLNGLLLPNLKKEAKINSIVIQNFSLQQLHPDESGANLVLKAKLIR